MTIEEFLKHLREEAEWGAEHSKGHTGHCNARRSLEVIITALRQYEGEAVENPVGWAEKARGVK